MHQCAHDECQLLAITTVSWYHPTKHWCEMHRTRIKRHGNPDYLAKEFWSFPTLKEEVASLAQQEYTRNQIAERLGVKWDSISKAYRRNRVPVPPIPLAPHPGSRR